MNKIQGIIWEIQYHISSIANEIEEKRSKKKYIDWNYENWVGSLEFIWGVKSWDDLTGMDCNMYTMNDIEIDFDHKTQLYSLSIETTYMFNTDVADSAYVGECNYLKDLLKAFTFYMDMNKLDKFNRPCFFMSHPSVVMSADTIEKLYTQFKIYVLGYIALGEE